MLVTFDPRINTGASVDAVYMNFLRCVRAICTMAAGTSSLTINPFTNNTGTIDNTRNCIVSIDANTEAGGWTESTASNVIQSGSFTAINTAAAGLYKFDCYNASGKGSLPFMKMSFHSPVMTSTVAATCYGNGNMYRQQRASWSSYNYIMFTYGASTASDWSSTNYAPVYQNASGYPNYQQRHSWTLNSWGGNAASVPNTSMGAMFYCLPAQTVRYQMAVTANYCIIWEVHTNNNYISGFSNTFANVPSDGNGSSSYGGLMYMGLRETQAWENSRSDNPPWVAMQVHHTGVYGSGPNTSGQQVNYPTPPNNVCAYMATINNSGVPSATSQRYFSVEQYNVSCTLFGNANRPINPTNQPNSTGRGDDGGLTSQTDTLGITTPLWWGRDNGMDYARGPGSSTYYSNQLYMPTVDTTTGTGVPSAYPIVIRTGNSNDWNAGGAIRGLYKSLSMPIATMRNYFANGQTFSIYNAVTATTDTYLPIVFNETMYLVRYA
jgi:hypothetical protein